MSAVASRRNGRRSDPDRANLLAAVDLGELLEELTGGQARGAAYPCPNPGHEQTGRTPPVSVSLSNGYQVWHCHACGSGGSAIDALILAHGLTARDASEELRRRAGVIEHADPPPTRKAPQPPSRDDARRYAEALTPDALERLRALRAWSADAIRDLGLGIDRGLVVFPVRDRSGAIAGLLRYEPDPDRRNGKPKMRGTKGCPRQPFPHPEEVLGTDLAVCEGEPDAVALRSLGLAAVGLPGTGKRDPAWWPRLAAGRDRIIVYGDCDGAGRASAAGWGEALAEHCSDVRLVDLNPVRDDGYDVGDLVREVVRAHGEEGYQVARERLEALAEHAARVGAGRPQEQAAHPYTETEAGLFGRGRDGPVRLANFTARITADTLLDDGSGDVRRTYTISARLHSGATRELEVQASAFNGMAWVPDLGAEAVLAAGQGSRDRAREAIQLLSSPRSRRVYTHTGWIKHDGKDVFLHAAGGIDADGPVTDIEVRLPPEIQLFELPASANSDHLKKAIRASLDLLELGPPEVMGPVMCGVYRSVIGGADQSVYIEGPTGSYKTELSALAQQHFGAGLDARHLPGSWSWTANSLEELAFRAKDVVLVVDDFVPAGSKQDASRKHRDADRIFRAQGNHSGRGRMTADGIARPPRPPRGLILSTGEDLPRGQSLRARMVIAELRPGMITPAALTIAQAQAADGVLAQAIGGYVQWLAVRGVEDVRHHVNERRRELRDRAFAGEHKRTPANLAGLACGLEVFLTFAIETGAIDLHGAETVWQGCWTALGRLAALQARHQAEADPARLFLSLLAGGIASGRAHLAGIDGDQAASPEACGWREGRPDGDKLGWIDWTDDTADVYLHPDSSYRFAQRAADDTSQPLNLRQIALQRALREAGLINVANEKDGRLTVRPRIAGRRFRVLHLKPAAAAALLGDDTDLDPGRSRSTAGAVPVSPPLVPVPNSHRDQRIPSRGQKSGPIGPGCPGLVAERART